MQTYPDQQLGKGGALTQINEMGNEGITKKTQVSYWVGRAVRRASCAMKGSVMEDQRTTGPDHD